MEYEERKKRKTLTPLQALVKAQATCAYQERCQQEMRDKLYEWGLHSEAVENMIAQLISDNFLNEERFAKAFAGGKFRIISAYSSARLDTRPVSDSPDSNSLRLAV